MVVMPLLDCVLEISFVGLVVVQGLVVVTAPPPWNKRVPLVCNSAATNCTTASVFGLTTLTTYELRAKCSNAPRVAP